MPRVSTSRARRRSAAEMRALQPLRRQIGNLDLIAKHPYVREFTDAYQTYERVIPRDAVLDFCATADVLLVSDFHALDACQQFAGDLLQQLVKRDRSPTLLLEAIFTRDQHIVDEWQSGTISDSELRRRLRFDAEWGYAWAPFLKLLRTARDLRIPIYGADFAPRGSMRRIRQRDAHAADSIERIRKLHPGALLVTLFGESHLAPSHLPEQVKKRLPEARVKTLLQNVDALYFRSAGELRPQVEAVQVDDSTIAVFNATPVEKWQSYSLCLARWRNSHNRHADFAPALYDLIDALLSFLLIDQYGDDELASRYFVDCYPEVAVVKTLRAAERLLWRNSLSSSVRREALLNLAERGSCYVPELNLIVVFTLRMSAAAEDVTAFVHHACRDFEALPISADGDPRDLLYRKALHRAVIAFGTRILYPSHRLNDEDELLSAYSEAREEIEAATLLSYRDYMKVIDAVMLHRDYELCPFKYAAEPALIQEVCCGDPQPLELLAERLGELLGGDLYQAYLEGGFSRSSARSLFFRRLGGRNVRDVYFNLASKVRTPHFGSRAA